MFYLFYSATQQWWGIMFLEVAIDNRLSVAISLLTTGKIFKN